MDLFYRGRFIFSDDYPYISFCPYQSGRFIHVSYVRGWTVFIVSKLGHVFRQTPDYGEIVIIDSRTQRMRSWADDLSEPALNYVALFSRSGQGHNVWVKRVIGKGGDKLEFHDNAVYRNGTKLNEPYINGVMEFSMPGSFTVPEGTIFVMGDNRNHSSDSRFIGPIPIDHVLGTVVVEL